MHTPPNTHTQITLILISFQEFLLLHRLTSMVRLFLGAAIQKILSKKLESSLFPLVPWAGSVSVDGPWTANAGAKNKTEIRISL